MRITHIAQASIPVEKFIPGGQTLGTLPDGRKIFFWGALPGETVTEYNITKQKFHYLEAIATAVTNPSAQRISPRDACYLSTSPWQILAYDYELATKRELIAEQFRQANLPLALSDRDCQPANLANSTQDCQIIPPLITDGRDFYYRNKMEYSLYYDHADGQIHPAFHARGSHCKIPVTTSSIEHPALWQKATEIINELNQSHADARRYQSLLLRCDQQGQVSGGLYENGRPHPVFDQLTDTLLGHSYSYSPNGFFQINLPVYASALAEIKQHITTDKVLDLYSGVGSIGLSVANDRELTLVECDAAAYRELINNVNLISSGNFATFQNGISTVLANSSVFPNINSVPQYIAALAKSEEVLNYITPDHTVILDPPRAGCHAKLIERLLTVTPPTIIYLSCNPATQARDLAALVAKYNIIAIQPFNFFPRTPHIENLVVLTTK